MNHWGTLFENSKEQAINCLWETVQKGNGMPVSDARKAYNRAHRDARAFIVFEYPEKPVRFLAICEANPKEKKVEVVTGYPFLKEGEPVIFEILDLTPSKGVREPSIVFQNVATCFRFLIHFCATTKTSLRWAINMNSPLRVSPIF